MRPWLRGRAAGGQVQPASERTYGAVDHRPDRGPTRLSYRAMADDTTSSVEDFKKLAQEGLERYAETEGVMLTGPVGFRVYITVVAEADGEFRR